MSALIHAATMVTAGVYLLIRSSPLIECSDTTLLICGWIGAFTTIFSSLVAGVQLDIKRVIAYSTMSQLGMMVVAISASSYNLALFHLFNHAFYKALLFLGSGAVIHSFSDNQDLRRYGGAVYPLPLTHSVTLLATFSLVAFPFLSGFYSKDLILELVGGSSLLPLKVIYSLILAAAFFTTGYATRSLFLTFYTNPAGSSTTHLHLHEGGFFTIFPLVLLTLPSLVFGYLTRDFFVGPASPLLTFSREELSLEREFSLTSFTSLLPLISLLTSTLTLIFLTFTPHLRLFLIFTFSSFIRGLANAFNLPSLYNEIFVRPLLTFGISLSQLLDRGLTERVLGHGLKVTLYPTSLTLTHLSRGRVTDYGLILLFTLFTLLSLISLTGGESFPLSSLLFLLSLFNRLSSSGRG